MKHVEVSRRIRLTRDVSEDDLRKALLERLRRSFDVNSITENDKGFHFDGTSGGMNKFMNHAHVDLNVNLVKNNEICRVVIHGQASASRSLMVIYSVLFFIILMVGLLPGSIETNGIDSDAQDTMVLLIFGIFIFYDINNKINEPKDALVSILNSLETEFG
jgi:hypothetical protein